VTAPVWVWPARPWSPRNTHRPGTRACGEARSDGTRGPWEWGRARGHVQGGRRRTRKPAEGGRGRGHRHDPHPLVVRRRVPVPNMRGRLWPADACPARRAEEPDLGAASRGCLTSSEIPRRSRCRADGDGHEHFTSHGTRRTVSLYWFDAGYC